MNQGNQTVGEKLSQWKSIRCLNRKIRTQEFYQDVFKLTEKHWPDLRVPVEAVPVDMVLTFANLMTTQCASRWNAMVAALRYVLPSHGKLLQRRPVRARHFNPPTGKKWQEFLTALDSNPRTDAGIVVRFLAMTGLRISEARALTWANVGRDSLFVPGIVTKSGKPRCIPLLEGTGDVLRKLRALDGGEFVLPRQNVRRAIEVTSRQVFGVKWSYHCLRHLFATRCVESGVDMPTVARWLGHQDGGALLSKTYFHLADQHSRTMAAKVRI